MRALYWAASAGNSGRGPTKERSPRNTFQSCGSSSILVLRNSAPTRVTTLGSSFVIDLNFKILTTLLFCTTRSCVKKIGPPSSSLIAKTMNGYIKRDKIPSINEAPMSVTRFKKSYPVFDDDEIFSKNQLYPTKESGTRSKISSQILYLSMNFIFVNI